MNIKNYMLTEDTLLSRLVMLKLWLQW